MNLAGAVPVRIQPDSNRVAPGFSPGLDAVFFRFSRRTLMRKFLGGTLTALALLGMGGGIARAETITAGGLPVFPNFGFNPSPVLLTAVDLSFPATGTGTMTSATFTWSSAPCAGTVKIKFFRRSGDAVFFVAERGPFDAGSNTQTVALAPPVSVQAGDLIGIARVVGCGSPVGVSPGGANGLVAFSGDIATGVSISSGTSALNSTLAVMATGSGTAPPATNPASIVPVVISSPGVPGSNFRVAVQLYNPNATLITGRLVFHPQGVPAGGSDPALPYSINAGQTQFLGDVLAVMGQSGIGSLDVFVTTGGAPVASVRVYNDGGTTGTSGLTEDALKLSEALSAGARGVLIGPFDSLLYRFNVGVRTLAGGATIAITVRDSSGLLLRNLSRTYLPNFFQQSEVATFLDGLPLASNQTITVDVVSGSLFLYGATADNRTHDPALQFAKNIL
jgi:hypothetical protein